MKKLYLRIYNLSIFLLLISADQFVDAQPTRLQATHLTSDDSLSSSIISSIIQDNEGFIWVGTIDRLNSYDGFNFLIYRASLSYSTSLPDKRIGISNDIKSQLFRIDSNLTVKETENEKGRGLGLLLFNEFAEKQSGKIRVDSEPE